MKSEKKERFHMQEIYVFSSSNILFDHIWQLNDNHIHLAMCGIVVADLPDGRHFEMLGNLYWALFCKILVRILMPFDAIFSITCF